MSVCSDSGGLALMKAGERTSQYIDSRAAGRAAGPREQHSIFQQPTFGSHVFCALHVVHGLKRLSLLLSKGLFIIVFSGSADAIEYDASA